ncbi:acyltransferase [Spirosoma agri]|uniref:Acyltransferase n=1 Tax=Spirosoma agri TaxID=1987381 RepID=A0A6M0IN36_9BACT|nr:acyltransferase [Spirosoma agri]NEU69322.1 acyltransferase [Spirosoma agri]
MKRLLTTIAKLARDIRHLPNTIRFNFHYFPVRTAMHLPVMVSANVRLVELKGNVILKGPVEHRMIRIGFGHVGIFDQKNSRSIWEVSGTVQFDGTAQIGHGSKICVRGNLRIGTNFTITAESQIVCFHEIVFGRDCLLSWEILVMDTDFHKLYNGGGQQINKNRSIRVGNKNWIGCRALILKGASTPDNCIIAAGSTVSRQLLTGDVVLAGSPADVIRTGVTWEK